MLLNSNDGLEPNHYPEILAYIKNHQLQQQQDKPFDVVFMTNFFYWLGENKFNEMISDYTSVGVNWFVHCFHPWEGDFDTYKQLVKKPPIK